MNDNELALLVAATSPIDERRVAQLPLSGPEDDLLEAIMSTDPVTECPIPEVHRLHPRRWVSAVAAAVALVVGLVTVQQLRGGGSPAWAAEVRAVAEAAPRLLVDRLGWTVTRADEFSVDQGEMTFGDGKQELDLLGAKVAGEVACRWIDRWIAAEDAGGTAAGRQAVEAMATSHRWSILIEMSADGAYPDVLWGLADAMAPGGTVPTGGKGVGVREAYISSLGCGTLTG